MEFSKIQNKRDSKCAVKCISCIGGDLEKNSETMVSILYIQ